MRAVRDTMIIAPPLVISREQIDELAEKAWRCLDLTMPGAGKKAAVVVGPRPNLGETDRLAHRMCGGASCP